MFEKDGKKFLVMCSREIKSALTNIAKLYSEMINDQGHVHGHHIYRPSVRTPIDKCTPCAPPKVKSLFLESK